MAGGYGEIGGQQGERPGWKAKRKEITHLVEGFTLLSQPGIC
jgi:hypothetical protein